MTEQKMSLARVQEVSNSNPGLAKSYTALQTVHQRFNIYASSCVALALWLTDRHPANLLDASALYSDYNERFCLIFTSMKFKKSRKMHNPKLL